MTGTYGRVYECGLVEEHVHCAWRKEISGIGMCEDACIPLKTTGAPPYSKKHICAYAVERKLV